MLRHLRIPVEGALAYPRVTSFEDTPPFGNEWMLVGAPFAPIDVLCIARLTTSFIDVRQPHRTCRWRDPAPATEPCLAGFDAGLPISRGRDRRPLYAAAWSIGALSIIGWLITTYEPLPYITSAPVTQVASSTSKPDMLSGKALNHTTYAGHISTPVQHRTPSIDPTSQPAYILNLAPKSDLALQWTGPAATAWPVPEAGHQQLRLRHQREEKRNPRARMPAPSGQYEFQPVQVSQNKASAEKRSQPRPSRHTRNVTTSFFDPLALTAMASALRTGQLPMVQTRATNFDWMSHLSHRRLTESPDAFIH